MPQYTLTTSAKQEDVAAWEIRRRQRDAAIDGVQYAGPATTGQLLLEWLGNDFTPVLDAYNAAYSAALLDEMAKATDADTKAAILARVAARMLA